MDPYFHITDLAFKEYISCHGHYTPKPEQLIQGLYFECDGSNCILTQYDVYKGDNLVGYVRLRGGDLSASFPNSLTVDAYYHKFKDEHKGDFASKKEERFYLNEIATALNKCIEEYEKVLYSQDEDCKWEYYASLTGKDPNILKARIKNSKEYYQLYLDQYFDVYDFIIFLWLFGCDDTLKIFGREGVEFFFDLGICKWHGLPCLSYISQDFFIELEHLPSLKSKEEYYWLRKIMNEHPDVNEEEILKFYHQPIDTEKEFKKRFPNQQCLPCFDSGGGSLYPSTVFSDTTYGTMAFQAGINEVGKNGDIVVFVNGEETQDKHFKDAVLRGLNSYRKANWICVVSLVLRTAAFNINGTYNRETRDWEIFGTVKEDWLKAITWYVCDVIQECARWDCRGTSLSSDSPSGKAILKFLPSI